MQFDLKQFLRTGRVPYAAALECDLSGWDWPGYEPVGPVKGEFSAALGENGNYVPSGWKLGGDAYTFTTMPVFVTDIRVKLATSQAGLIKGYMLSDVFREKDVVLSVSVLLPFEEAAQMVLIIIR